MQWRGVGEATRLSQVLVEQVSVIRAELKSSAFVACPQVALSDGADAGKGKKPSGSDSQTRYTSPGGSRHTFHRDASGQQAGGTVHSDGTVSTGYLHKPKYGGESDSPKRAGQKSSGGKASTSGRH